MSWRRSASLRRLRLAVSPAAGTVLRRVRLSAVLSVLLLTLPGVLFSYAPNLEIGFLMEQVKCSAGFQR